MEEEMLKKHDLVQHAVMIYLSENAGKRKFNHAIQFSTFSRKMYCLYYRDNNIFDIPQIITPTLLNDQEQINQFECMMLNRNIERVSLECLYFIHYEKQWHVEMS